LRVRSGLSLRASAAARGAGRAARGGRSLLSAATVRARA
jgi:hypothetical protein